MTGKNRVDQTVAIEGQLATPSRSGGTLIISPGAEGEQKIQIPDTPLVVGKSSQADLQIDDPTVSKRHFEIRKTAGGVQLVDLGSRNGTKINGIGVHGALLENGCLITFGRTKIRFESDIKDVSDIDAPTKFGDALGRSKEMRQVFSLLSRIAPTDLTITILGETGTGKDVLARGVHKHSPRGTGPFVVFDCGAVAPTLIESQLFGHTKGSFTGATEDRTGAFEQANGGTLFLDEIGELNLELQPKLLRVLEQRRVRPVGGDAEIPVDVRIVTATNRDLEREVAGGRFREDLYFRLSTAVVRLPALRERQEDLFDLANFFADQQGIKVTEETHAVLQEYDWPGNVRELKNVLAGALAVAEGGVLRPKDFVFFKKRHRAPTLERLPLGGRNLEAVEKAAIRQTLNEFGGNKTQAAKALGIAPSTLYAKIKKYEL